jgi:hypothetical protein
MIFVQMQQAMFNTVLISVLGVASIVIGSLITKWEKD